MKKNSVGLAMIVRNEEANMPSFLESIQGLFEQVVIVDTGSTDSTKKLIIESIMNLNCLLLEIPWENDFSKARNYSFSKLKTDFIVWLDADDRITPEMISFIYELKSMDFATANDGFYTRYSYFYDNLESPSLVLPRLQIVKKSAQPVWHYKVFEQLNLRKDATYKNTGIMIRHLVKSSQSESKLERDIKILETSLKIDGENTHDLFFLGMSYYSRSLYLKAIDAFQRYLIIDPRDSVAQTRLLQSLFFSLQHDQFVKTYQEYPLENTILRGPYLEMINLDDEALVFYQNNETFSLPPSDLFSREEKKFWMKVFPLQRQMVIFDRMKDFERVKKLKLELLKELDA